MGLDDPNLLIALISLTTLQLILGFDNIILVATLAETLPEKQKKQAMSWGLALAMLARLAMLFAVTSLLALTEPVFNVFDTPISIKDMLLISGGLFLIIKGVNEIYERLETDNHKLSIKKPAGVYGVIAQIIGFDIIFSWDSVVTAVGMTNSVATMVAAIILSVIVMIAFSGKVSEILARHPSMKVLALSFLLLIGATLIGDGFGLHISKGYIYFAMAFAAGVEALNIKMKKRDRRKSIALPLAGEIAITPAFEKTRR